MKQTEPMKIFFCLQMFYMAVAIYAPSLALSAVTPLKLDLTVIFTSLLCTIYTSLVSLIYILQMAIGTIKSVKLIYT